MNANRIQKCADGALAIRTGHLHFQIVLVWIPKLCKKDRDILQPKLYRLDLVAEREQIAFGFLEIHALILPDKPPVIVDLPEMVI